MISPTDRRPLLSIDSLIAFGMDVNDVLAEPKYRFGFLGLAAGALFLPKDQVPPPPSCGLVVLGVEKDRCLFLWWWWWCFEGDRSLLWRAESASGSVKSRSSSSSSSTVAVEYLCCIPCRWTLTPFVPRSTSATTLSPFIAGRSLLDRTRILCERRATDARPSGAAHRALRRSRKSEGMRKKTRPRYRRALLFVVYI